eukprot:TRINITY_DN44682_c0_g1_i2.p1 TRINITY_DN44682_c0_g1~~TRINITY_DN44682_c0_g1_i2.p1  ORF type:complete len:378 (-),score=80.81 TRINITY_DN44682_c0_g1_i2:248-1381(-)
MASVIAAPNFASGGSLASNAPVRAAVEGTERGNGGGESAEAASSSHPTLAWHGRWGYWDDTGVLLAAPCIAEFQLSGIARSCSKFAEEEEMLEEAMKELREKVSGDLLEEGDIGFVICAESTRELQVRGSSVPRHGVRLAILGHLEDCLALSDKWQGQKLCDGRVTASWCTTQDTTAESHHQPFTSKWRKAEQTETVCFSIPPSWTNVARNSTARPGASGSVKLQPDSHWYKFLTLFGELAHAELSWRGGDSAPSMHVIAQFASPPDSSRSLMEILGGRVLFNPFLEDGRAAHLVAVRAGRLDDLRQAARGQEDPAGRYAYCLRRCDAGSAKEPAEVWITKERPHAWLGRCVEKCDLVVPFEHLSRQHARVELQARA